MTTDTHVARIKVDSIRAHGTNVRKNLGDLRDLAESVRRFGIMQPITVEKRPDHWILRDGHRRVAVATMLGLDRVPAVIHGEHLDDDEWLTHAVHHNQRRRALDKADKVHTVQRMREAGMTWDGIAREFGVSTSAVRQWIRPSEVRDRRSDRVNVSTLAAFVGSWREAVERGQASDRDAFDALVRAIETRCFEPHAPSKETA